MKKVISVLISALVSLGTVIAATSSKITHNFYVEPATVTDEVAQGAVDSSNYLFGGEWIAALIAVFVFAIVVVLLWRKYGKKGKKNSSKKKKSKVRKSKKKR